MIWTADGGRTWYDATPAGARAVVNGGVAFAPGTTAARPGWAMVQEPGRRALLSTPDGGRTWRALPVPAALQQTAILGLSFADAIHGWLLSSGAGPDLWTRSALYRTVDGGRRWSEMASRRSGRGGAHVAGLLPPGGDESGIAFATLRRGWLTGVPPTPGRILLLATRDGGRLWSAARIALPASLPDVQLQSQPPVFFARGRGILAVQRLGRIPPAEVFFFATRDGGASWSPAGAAIDRDPAASGFVWSFGDPVHGWAADGAHVYATRDGGRRWSVLPTSGLLAQVSELAFVGATDGWAVSGGRLLGTSDGGRTWTVLAGRRF